MKKKLFKLVLLVFFVCIFLYINNNWLQVNEYSIESERIPQAFDGLKIVQLSDLHDAEFGNNHERLVGLVKEEDPDLIFLTGDLVDSNRYDLEQSLRLVTQLKDMAAVYYVTGNHEVAVNQVPEISEALRELGVHVLENESEVLVKEGEELIISGVEDPLMKGLHHPEGAIEESLDKALGSVPQQDYKVLLSHRPEVFDTYVDRELDLVLTGHAHGGQFRIPGIGGLVAPGQGWFPAYTSGKHERGITTMIVSRGLGNSNIPFRILNRPEVVVVTLRSEE